MNIGAEAIRQEDIDGGGVRTTYRIVDADTGAVLVPEWTSDYDHSTTQLFAAAITRASAPPPAIVPSVQSVALDGESVVAVVLNPEDAEQWTIPRGALEELAQAAGRSGFSNDDILAFVASPPASRWGWSRQ